MADSFLTHAAQASGSWHYRYVALSWYIVQNHSTFDIQVLCCVSSHDDDISSKD